MLKTVLKAVFSALGAKNTAKLVGMDVGAAILGVNNEKKPEYKAQPESNHTEVKKLPSITLNGQSLTVPANNSESNNLIQNNQSKGGKNMASTKFTILGESLSGKTCYLLAMYSEMSQGINGYSIVAQNDDLDTELIRKFDKLDDETLSVDRFPFANDQVDKYLFNLTHANKTIMSFEWVDYPGGTLREKGEFYDEISNNVRDSSTLFICVDGKLLVGDDTERKIRQVKRKCSMTINRCFGKYFEAGGRLPTVGIILTKADLFMNDTNDDEVCKILQESFSPLFCAENIKIGVIPVSLGKGISDDEYRGELDPINIHLPIFMGIWCMLNDLIQAYKHRIEQNNGTTIEQMQEIEEMQKACDGLRPYLDQILWFANGYWQVN